MVSCLQIHLVASGPCLICTKSSSGLSTGWVRSRDLQAACLTSLSTALHFPPD